MTDTDANKAIVRQFMKDVGEGNIERMLDTYAEDAFLLTTGRTLISGRYSKADIAKAGAVIFEAFPEGIDFEILTMTAEEDRVAVEARSYGRHISGQDYSNYYHFLFRLRDGQITEMKEFMDTELVTDILCGGQRPAA